MILGIGTDIVSVNRINAALQRHPQRFMERVLGAGEREAFSASACPARHLAKRFAAKEAASKALGTGIGAMVGWHDLSVHNDETGRPTLTISNAALQRLEHQSAPSVHLSLSDEQDYAIAFVVLESGGELASQL